MTQLRTPRPHEGEDLVPMTVMVLPDTKERLRVLAVQDRRSLSQVGRIALEAYVDHCELARDVTSG